MTDSNLRSRDNDPFDDGFILSDIDFDQCKFVCSDERSIEKEEEIHTVIAGDDGGRPI